MLKKNWTTWSQSDALHNDFVEHDAVTFDNFIPSSRNYSEVKYVLARPTRKGSDVPRTIYNTSREASLIFIKIYVKEH